MIHLNAISTAALAFFIGAGAAHGQEARSGQWTIIPFWKSGIMEGESVLFVRERGGEPAKAPLLFTPARIVGLKSADGRTVYEEGKDFTWKRGSREIELPAGSRIPLKNRADMYPPNGAPQSIEGLRGKTVSLFFGEGHLFHDLQTEVTYSHEERWTGYRPSFAGDRLTQSIAKLKGRKSFTLLLLGDSISEGYNASGFTKTPPFMPPYGQLLALSLESAYRTPVKFVNLSLAGKNTVWALEQSAKAAAVKPDLMIVAFGMNDASSGMAPDVFAGNIRRIMETVRAESPSCEFILVAGMTGNPEWSHSAPELYPRYRDALAALEEKGVVLANVTALWTDILARKRFIDITGNGVNHPNDFGHRLYATVLSGLLIE